MKIYFISYSDNKFKEAREKMVDIIKSTFDFDVIINYDREFLEKSPLYQECKTILDMERGGGYCLWKPYIILHTLQQVDDGDIVLYLDSTDLIVNGFKEHMLYCINENDGFFLIDNVHKNSHWTKRDTFVLMDCDDNLYWDSTQLEAGCCAFKKGNNTISLVEEWLKYCKNINIITDLPNISGKDNLLGYNDHRYDQSVLTNLSVKYNLRRSNMAYIYYNLIH